MKYLDEYRDNELTRPLVEELRNSVTKPLRFDILTAMIISYATF